MTEKRTAKDMLDLLEKHYAPPPSKPAAGRLISEIQAPQSLRRADALWLPITTGQRGQIIGHEIKVSRSDVIAEISDPHKADAWARYCTRWWLVVSDPALVDGLDIPPEWGVMAPPTRNRFMTILVKAPVLTPDPTLATAAWGTIYAREAYSDLVAAAELRYANKRLGEMEVAVREAQAEARRATADAGGDVSIQYGRITVAKVMAEIERLGDYRTDGPRALRGAAWHVDPTSIAIAVLAAHADDMSPQRLRDEIEVAQRRAAATAKNLSDLLTQLRNGPTT